MELKKKFGAREINVCEDSKKFSMTFYFILLQFEAERGRYENKIGIHETFYRNGTKPKRFRRIKIDFGGSNFMLI